MRRLVLAVPMAVALAAYVNSTPSGIVYSMQLTTATTSLPVVEIAATPKGWVPVDYGAAQISVPASFGVYYPGQGSRRLWATPGALFLGPLAADTVQQSCSAPQFPRGGVMGRRRARACLVARNR
jgi:hypothetical protein